MYYIRCLAAVLLGGIIISCFIYNYSETGILYPGLGAPICIWWVYKVYQRHLKKKNAIQLQTPSNNKMLKIHKFGEIPYHGCLYGPISDQEVTTSGNQEIDTLNRLLIEFKNGIFKNIDKLKLMVDSSDEDVRLYCHQLLAHTCNHEEVKFFNRILDMDGLDMYDICRVLSHLGETSSLNAIPIIFEIVDAYDDPDLYVDASFALFHIFPYADDYDDEYEIFENNDLKSDYLKTIKSLNPELYYHNGGPLFLGDITKQLIINTSVSFKEQEPVIITEIRQMLSNNTGIICPIDSSEIINDNHMRKVFDYVKQIASHNKWQAGVKYFYGHQIV